MKIVALLVITVFTQETRGQDNDQVDSQAYNILSLMGGAEKAYMMSGLIDNFEKEAYQIVQLDQCKINGQAVERDSQKIAMHEIFDMIAGVETGAIIASSLLVPNDDDESKDFQQNKYFANETMELFKKNSKSLFHRDELPYSFGFFLYVSILLTICSYCFLYT